MLILITILWMLGNSCFNYVMSQAILPGQIFGGWQNVLEDWYSTHPLLEKFLGGCYMCFSHFLALCGLAVYLFWQYHYDWLGWWNVLVYLAYVPGVIVFSLIINKILSSDAV